MSKSRFSKLFKIALIGNPNSGKSSLFNALTGLKQHVANFPGVTVDKKTALLKLNKDIHILLTDFPGAYSLYPNSDDERIVSEILSNPLHPDFPDAVIYVLDPFDLRRQLLMFTQLKDLNIPVLVVFTMKDIAQRKGLQLDTEKFTSLFGSDSIIISSKSRDSINELKDKIAGFVKTKSEDRGFYNLSDIEQSAVDRFRDDVRHNSDYQLLLQIQHSAWLRHISRELKEQIREFKEESGFNDLSFQINETMERYRLFDKKARSVITAANRKGRSNTDRVDEILTHRFFGPVIFFIVMMFVFQAIFSFATIPMDLLENGFLMLSEYIKSSFDHNWFTMLVADGILPGLAGVLVFVPQIFILFLMIGIMEEIGYMSRVIFMFDDIMKGFGMNGRSLVALISGGACAIPAIMSTRTISSWKERLITIMVTPLISCSARLPVYTLLIIFAVPDESIGIFNLRGLSLMGLYLLGIVMAFASAFVMKYIIRIKSRSYLILSLPAYKKPMLKNIAYYVKEKVGAFVFGAGKIILMISIILWILASNGPGNNMMIAEQNAVSVSLDQQLTEAETENLIASYKLESSYIGILGKKIEPAIVPLGFDWKIGIAIIASFAAREVFVGTMATIYSLGSADDNLRISERMRKEINPATGRATYNVATSWSLLVFYVFALQCISTIVVVFRETRSWKWPFVQFLYMGILAYLFSYIVYNALS